jgi:hypothetical protein
VARLAIELNLEGDASERILKALCGLTRLEAENALYKAIVTTSRLDPADLELLLAEKEQIVRKSGILELYSSPEQFGLVGGLDQLKLWLRQRSRAFSEAVPPCILWIDEIEKGLAGARGSQGDTSRRRPPRSLSASSRCEHGGRRTLQDRAAVRTL